MPLSTTSAEAPNTQAAESQADGSGCRVLHSAFLGVTEPGSPPFSLLVLNYSLTPLVLDLWHKGALRIGQQPALRLSTGAGPAWPGPPMPLASSACDAVRCRRRRRHSAREQLLHRLLLLPAQRLASFTLVLLTPPPAAADYRVCADGGANQLSTLVEQAVTDPNDRSRYVPDLITGDLDSLRPEVRSMYEDAGIKVRVRWRAGEAVRRPPRRRWQRQMCASPAGPRLCSAVLERPQACVS